MTQTVYEEGIQDDVQFSVREVPWMKLGKLVDQPVTAREAAKLSGLDFEVELQDVAWIGFGNEDESGVKNLIHPIPKRKAVVAKDNGQFMGFVSSTKYNMLQYADAFDFMDHLGAPYVAAGALRGRRQGFMVVKPQVENGPLSTSAFTRTEDPHDMFVTLRTSHDCTRGVEVMVMPLRGRCMNQLSLRSFAKGVPHRWSIKHTSTMQEKLKEAQKSLKNLGLYVAQFDKLATRMVNTEIKIDKAREMLEIVIPRPRANTERVALQYDDRLNAILDLWQTSPTVAYAGTGWGLVNALSEHRDWYRAGGTPESRFLNALEGETHKQINALAGLVLAA